MAVEKSEKEINSWINRGGFVMLKWYKNDFVGVNKA